MGRGPSVVEADQRFQLRSHWDTTSRQAGRQASRRASEQQMCNVPPRLVFSPFQKASMQSIFLKKNISTKSVAGRAKPSTTKLRTSSLPSVSCTVQRLSGKKMGLFLVSLREECPHCGNTSRGVSGKLA